MNGRIDPASGARVYPRTMTVPVSVALWLGAMTFMAGFIACALVLG